MSGTPTELESLGDDLVQHAARTIRWLRREADHPVGLRVLSLLDQYGAAGVSALATLDQCSQPTMTGTVNTLVERGWVTKAPDPRDARAQLVSLTDAGRATLAAARRTHGRLVAERLAAAGRSPAEIETAVAVLRALADTTPDNPKDTE